MQRAASQRGAQRGFSLVELMVSMVVALVIMAGALTVFVGMRDSFRLEDSLSRLQENSRYAVEAVASDVREAGFAGCVGTTFSNQLATKNLLDTTNASYDPAFYDISRPLTGFEYTGTGDGDTFTATTVNPNGVAVGNWSNDAGTALPTRLQNLVVPGTDVLIVKHAANRYAAVSSGVTGQGSTTVSLSQTSGVLLPNRIMLIADCGGGDVFQNVNGNVPSLSRGSGGTPGNSTAIWSHSYPVNAELYDYSIAVYYVGLGQGNEPALFRLTFPYGGAGSNDELVEGVENLQVLYGQDNGDDGEADSYVTAAAVTNWQSVVSIRLALLIRTPKESRARVDTNVYNLLGTTIDPLDERRERRVLLWTMAARNRTRLAGAP
jgi:type IV pilus assembly protein PilW